jgi:imidazoleglycerol phosphate dehydratase HisB
MPMDETLGVAAVDLGGRRTRWSISALKVELVGDLQAS